MWRKNQLFKKKETEHYDYPQLCMIQDSIDHSLFQRYISNENELIDNQVSIYIHIPFCKSICAFCNYYKVVYGKYTEEQIEEFVNAIVTEIQFYASVLPDKKKKISGVQFGGGTPTLLPAKYLQQIIKTIETEFDMSECEMYSMEGTMSSLMENNFERISQLAEVGINRLSFGVQSFSKLQRQKNGLVGDIDKFDRLCEVLRENGINDYNIDLMYNYPNQTPDEVIQDIERAFSNQVTNIDLYSLNVYPETTLYQRYKSRGLWEDYVNPEKENQYIDIYRYISANKDIHPIMANVISKKRKSPQSTLAIQLGNNKDNGGTTIGIGPSSRGNIDRFMYKNTLDMDEYIALVKEKGYSAIKGNLNSYEEIENRTLVMFPNFGYIKKENAAGIYRHREAIDKLIENNILIETEEELFIEPENLYWNGNIAAMFYSKSQKNKMIKSYFLSRKQKLNLYNQDKMQIK